MSTLNKDIIKKILELIHSESKKNKKSIEEAREELGGQITSVSNNMANVFKFHGTITASRINSVSFYPNYVYLVTEEFTAGTKFHSNYRDKTFPAYTWVVGSGYYYNNSGQLYVLTSDNDSSVEKFSTEEINTMVAEIFEEE